MSLPVSFMGRGDADARLEIVRPKVDDKDRVINLKFNPTQYKLKKDNTFAEVAIAGLESPALQYVRGGAQTLTIEPLLDTSDTLVNVRTKYVERLERLLKQDDKLHAPPIVDFIWAGPVFRGVLTSMEVTYVLFDIDGTPLRAQLVLALKEYRSPEVQAREVARKTSPDVDKRYVVRAGETLSSISAAVFRDPSLWREIAVANDIGDPRRVAPGTVLTIPRLEVARR